MFHDEKYVLNNDFLYRNMYKKYNEKPNFNDIVKLSGVLIENRTDIDEKMIVDHTILTVPIVPPKTNKKKALIMSTGSFSPLHEGHISSLKIAKEIAENLNYEVIQGIISLSHDDYVVNKNGNKQENNIYNRTMLAYKKIDELSENWIKVDHFEGEMLSIPVNFTTVINRTKRLFEHYINEEVDIFYVYGSDNYGFSYAFVDQINIYGVCVERDGFIKREDVEEINSSQLFYVKNNAKNYSISSTSIRKNNKKEIVEEFSPQQNIKNVYLIRGNSVPECFNKELKKIVEKYIEKGIIVRSYSTSSEKLNGFISLDKFIQGDLNLDVSRIFEISGYQNKANGILIEEKELPLFQNKHFDLIDDDIVSGTTINAVKEKLLKYNIGINQIKTIVADHLSNNEVLYDVIDSRDFYLNGYKSGLMIEMPNKQTKRVPYLFPFVNLSTRANILKEFYIEFSKEILELNKKYNKEGFIKLNGDFLLKIYENTKA